MSEGTCIEHEKASCRECAENEATDEKFYRPIITRLEGRLAIALAKRKFAEGFAHGADPDHARKRHVVDPLTDAHWRAGFKAGAAAAREALDEYVRNEGLR